MTTASTNLQFSGLTRCLIEKGLLTESDAQIHSQEAQKNQIPLIRYLVANKLINSKALAYQASQEFGVPFLIWMPLTSVGSLSIWSVKS